MSVPENRAVVGRADAINRRDSRLGDGRLDSCPRQLVEQMEAGFGESILLACQDWANTKAAYRFFSNDRVSEEDILRGHFDATRRRFAASDGPILILHDATEFFWRRRRPEAVGFTTKVSSGKDKSGRGRMHAVCGLLMHSSLAVTTDGLPLGMAAVKFWTRKKFNPDPSPEFSTNLIFHLI